MARRRRTTVDMLYRLRLINRDPRVVRKVGLIGKQRDTG